MNSLYFWLSAFMSVSVRGHTFPANGWSMTIADGVRAEEGGSAVLPCSFTHPDTNLTLTGSVIWKKYKKGAIFKCTYPGPDHSQGELCENVRQWDGGNRFRFVGNLSNKDLSIMMEGLSREDDGSYRCRVELNIGNFGTRRGTHLEVEAQSQGNWTTGHGGNRYELIGNPEEGNASTRINQLSVRDNHTYLCQVEYRSEPDSQYLIQQVTQLQVIPVKGPEPTIVIYQLIISLLSLLFIFFILIIMFIIFRKKRGYTQKIEQTTSLKRNDPGSSSIPETDQVQQTTIPDQDSSILYAEIDSNRTAQPDSCTYASIVFDSNRKGDKSLLVVESEESESVFFLSESSSSPLPFPLPPSLISVAHSPKCGTGPVGNG
ncbi:uncharacterized protein [Chiloscyllium punctatum]|uniref:uncharacterized protein isoform X4 n=1 Tax=Chiloscyllium punctatum TaxID=137246 RepID=UPI003B639ED5